MGRGGRVARLLLWDLSLGLLVATGSSPCTAQVEPLQPEPLRAEATQADRFPPERREPPRPQFEPFAPGNVITVRPSGPDGRPREVSSHEGRLERLERRLRRSDEAMRSICVGCGSREAGGAGPFNPAEALRGRAGAPSQMLVPRRLPDEVIVDVRELSGSATEALSSVPEAPLPDPRPSEP